VGQLAWVNAQVPLTDKLRSYPAARRAVMPSVVHCTAQYSNNRGVASDDAQRERQMRSAAQLQRFASVHGIVQNLFRVGRRMTTLPAC
jgi:putative transposase